MGGNEIVFDVGSPLVLFCGANVEVPTTVLLLYDTEALSEDNTELLVEAGHEVRLVSSRFNTVPFLSGVI
jgi:hypothetical protein